MEPEAAFEILNDDRGAKLDAAAIDALASAVHSQEKETL
jgi:HD-GYP domain-containing protein (c-di-GMP phosphodiesterase class II)